MATILEGVTIFCGIRRVAHRFSGGGHEWSVDSRPPGLKGLSVVGAPSFLVTHKG